MPIYEYNCPKCKERFELLRPLSKSDEDADCPKCHSVSKRALSRFISKSAMDLSSLSHMASGGAGGGSSCGSCSSTSCSTCGH